MNMLRITPVYDKLLRGSQETPVGLYHLQLATASQLCRLHYSAGSIKMVKARLKDLADAGYIQADAIPTKFTRSPYYYALNKKGVQYLAETGLDTHIGFRASSEIGKHALFIEHTLEVNDILVASALIQRTVPQYCLYGFIHERVLKRYPYKATWKTSGTNQVFTIVPDAFLDFRLTLQDGQRRLPIVLEHDRGTEGKDHFKRRIRAYITLLKTGAHQQYFGVKAITVAFTTFTGLPRVQQMVEWTRQELAASNEPAQLGAIFCFRCAALPLDAGQLWLDPVWVTTRTEDKPIALLTY